MWRQGIEEPDHAPAALDAWRRLALFEHDLKSGWLSENRERNEKGPGGNRGLSHLRRFKA
jgi:hypothetical protein